MKRFLPLLLILLLVFSGCDYTVYDGTDNTDSTVSITLQSTNAPYNEEEPVITSDPYVGVNKAEFYANYTPAVSASDAYYRSQHFLMSGSISEQNEEPTVSDDRLVKGGLYVRNSFGRYSEDGNTYYIIDSHGNVVNRVYKGGGYVTLEEVAAYVFAFGEIPANYISKKSDNPSTNPWGKYLRLNHSRFWGDTKKYPYEPLLPLINYCEYYELDVGTTGTTCDPSFKASVYNNGTRITRGAARIVYTRYYSNGELIKDINEKHLFYTNNHYNDFQEYLNYQGGWGEKFGNITGGGKLSDKNNCNPTPYVPTVSDDMTK